MVSDPASSCNDIDFPPGFEPGTHNLESFSESQPNSEIAPVAASVETKSVSHANLLSGALTKIQGSVENELYVAAKISLFKYFEDVIKEEMTALLCLTMEGSSNEVKFTNKGLFVVCMFCVIICFLFFFFNISLLFIFFLFLKKASIK